MEEAEINDLSGPFFLYMYYLLHICNRGKYKALAPFVNARSFCLCYHFKPWKNNQGNYPSF